MTFPVLGGKFIIAVPTFMASGEAGRKIADGASAHIHRHIIHVHIGIIRPSAGLLVIQEADANGLPGILLEVEGQLHPVLVIRGVHEELLQDIAAAVYHVGLLPAVGAGVVAGRPVVKAQADPFSAARNTHHLVGNRVALLPTAIPQP